MQRLLAKIYWRKKAVKNIFRIFLADYKRISRNVVAIVVVLGLMIIPCLYAWFNILSNWDPYGPSSTGNIKIAVASEDNGYNMGSTKVNIGSKVVAQLHGNKTLGWVFVKNSEEALEGVKSGEYYAALVMPKNFSETLFDVLYGKLEHPNIIYYENEKKNAIAPKITAKAPATLKEQVNATFASTITEALAKIFGTVSEKDKAANISGTLDETMIKLKNDLQTYINILNSFASITNSAESMLKTTQSIIPGFESTMKNSLNSINALQGSAIAASGQAENASDMILKGMDTINSSIDSTIKILNSGISAEQSANTSINNKVIAAQAAIPYIKQMFTSSIAGIDGKMTEDQKKQAEEIKNKLNSVTTDLDSMTESVNQSSEKLKELNDKTIAELYDCKRMITSLKTSYTTSVKPKIDSTMKSMMNSMVSVQAILCGINTDFSQVSDTIGSYANTLGQSTKTIKESAETAQNLLTTINKVDAEFNKLKNDEQYKKIVSMMKNDPEALSSFVSSPVNIKSVRKYPIDNYGSAMSPFYSILALWVGALILVAIIHIKVHPVEGVNNPKLYEKFFGRYITFFLIGQAQALLLTLGNLYYVGIQCKHPFLFWLGASVTSFVFTLFMYSLTFTFGNVGEAIAVVVMVIQVAGAGCTFPIDVLSDVFKSIYKFLPFQFGMNALKETVGGLYGNDFWKYIFSYSYVVILSLVIGLLLEKPFRSLMKKIEKSKKSSELLI